MGGGGEWIGSNDTMCLQTMSRSPIILYKNISNILKQHIISLKCKHVVKPLFQSPVLHLVSLSNPPQNGSEGSHLQV